METNSNTTKEQQKKDFEEVISTRANKDCKLCIRHNLGLN